MYSYDRTVAKPKVVWIKGIDPFHWRAEFGAPDRKRPQKATWSWIVKEAPKIKSHNSLELELRVVLWGEDDRKKETKVFPPNGLAQAKKYAKESVQSGGAHSAEVEGFARNPFGSFKMVESFGRFEVVA